MLEEVFLLIARGVERHPDVIALCKGLSLPLLHTGFVEQRAEAGIVGIHEDDADPLPASELVATVMVDQSLARQRGTQVGQSTATRAWASADASVGQLLIRDLRGGSRA